MPVGESWVQRSASRNNSGWFSFKVKAQTRPRRSTSLTKGACRYKASPTNTSRKRRPNCPTRSSSRANAVAFQAAGNFTTEREHGFGRLSFQRVAEGVVADRSDALGQRPMMTLGLDLQQAGNLHCGTQEDGVKHLFPRVLRKLPSLGQSAHQIREANHLVEIRLEPVSGQTWRSSFSLRNRLRFTRQMVAAAASKRRRISIFSRTLSTNSAGMLRAFGLPSISTEI